MFNIKKAVLKQALDLSPVATVIVDIKAQPEVVAYANQAFEAMSGYDADELVGYSWQELLTEPQTESTDNGFSATLACHSRLGVDEHLKLEMLPIYERPGLPRYWVGTERQHNDAEVEDHDRERDALLSVLRDARMHLRRLDGRDSATGLLNQRTFDDMLQRDWMMARREKRCLGLILFQVNALEGYREVYGRHAADSCLRKVAHAITGSLRRAGDLTARFADDRFVVLIGESDEERATLLAERIAAKVRGLSIHHPRSDVDRFVTVSFGVAAATPGNKTDHSVLSETAEQALESTATSQPTLELKALP